MKKSQRRKLRLDRAGRIGRASARPGATRFSSDPPVQCNESEEAETSGDQRERAGLRQGGVGEQKVPRFGRMEVVPKQVLVRGGARGRSAGRQAGIGDIGQAEGCRVGHIHEEIIASGRDAIIISNKADEYGITPNKAKGLNDYIGRKIYYVMMFPSPDQYRDLLVENGVFGTGNCVKLHLLDEFDQIVGRTLVFRYRSGSEVIVIMPTRLWRQIRLTLLTESNYDAQVIAERPW